MAGITSTGIGSGMNISSLVAQLVQAEQLPAASRLDRQEATIQAKISSIGNFKSSLSSFRDSLAALKNLGTFEKVTATSGDSTLFTASAEKNADLASYKVEVKKLAQAHALASGSYSSADAVIGTGTLTIKFGTTTYDSNSDTYSGFVQNSEKGTLTLSIDNTNNTLTGIRDAINKAKAGVTAAVVNDGSGYRLVLNSTDSGAKNSLQVSASGGDGGLSVLAFNGSATNMTQTQEAVDAEVGINGLTVKSASNTVTGALKGVTLNLLQAQTGKTVNLTVSQNNSDITKSAEGFVKSFNDLVKTVKDLAGYDATKKVGGILQGDALVRGALSQLRSELGASVKGLDGSIKTLSDIGVRIQSDGTLSLDKGKLDKALSSDRSSVAAVFAAIGRPTDAGIAYSESTADTKTGEYAVNITQLATQGYLNGATANSFTVDANNDTFKIKVDGTLSGAISLTHSADVPGGYTGASLAAEIQSRINGDSALKAKGIAVSVSYSGNKFVIQSNSYGAASQVAVTEVDTDTTSTIGLRVAASDDPLENTGGKDVAGSIGGVAAEGKGQELKATSGDANGLKLTISGSLTGDRGTVKFSRGMVERLDKVLSGMLDSKGSIAARTEGLQKSLDQIQEQREKLDERMQALEKRLLQRFNAMDALLGQFQTTSSYLGQQLATLPLSKK